MTGIVDIDIDTRNIDHPFSNETKTNFMAIYLWWGKMILISLFAIAFFVLGIATLISAFHLKNPLEFIMYFFSSNFIILVSLVGIFYPIFQVYTHFQTYKDSHDKK